MTYTVTQIIEAIREEINEGLEKKTSWRKNEVKLVIEKAITRAVVRFMER